MDAYMIVRQLEKNKSKLEKMNSSSNTKSVGSNLGLLISILIGAYASYLSYECNTKKNISETHKIFYAVLAYIFGLFYLIYYFLFRFDTCHDL